METKLSRISRKKRDFDELTSIYQEALNKSGYNQKLKFRKVITTNT